MTALAWDFAPDRTRQPFLLRNDIPAPESGSTVTTWPVNTLLVPLESFTNVGDRPFAQTIGGGPAALSHLFGAGTDPQASIIEVDTGFGASCKPLTAPLHFLPCGTFHYADVDVNASNMALTGRAGGQLGVPFGFRRGISHQGNVNAAAAIACMEAVRDLFALVTSGAWVQPASADVAASNEPASVASGSPADPHPSLSLCLRALHQRRAVLSDIQAAALKRQLRVLLQEEDDLQSANITVSVPSLHGLIDFLSEYRTGALPSLSVTRDGYFAASWSPRKRAKLTIVFRPSGAADWIATDLDAAPPIHQKGPLANHQDEFAAWANA